MSFWFRSLATGEKVVADTVQEIARKAQREANRFGQAVQIHHGSEGRKSHRVAAKRNPAVSWKPYHHSYEMLTKAAATRAIKSIRERWEGSGKRFKIAPALDSYGRPMPSGTFTVYVRNPISDEIAGHGWRMHQARSEIAAAKRKATAKHLVRGTKKAKRPASRDAALAKRAGARRSDNPWPKGSMGHAVWDAAYMRNPATKASIARRKASNKRGAYVEYLDGTKKARIHYKNRGIATIRAAAMKKDGWRGVRVVSA